MKVNKEKLEEIALKKEMEEAKIKYKKNVNSYLQNTSNKLSGKFGLDEIITIIINGGQYVEAQEVYNANKDNIDAAYWREIFSPFKTMLPIGSLLQLVYFMPKNFLKKNFNLRGINIPYYSINKNFSQPCSVKKLLIAAGLFMALPTFIHLCVKYYGNKEFQNMKKFNIKEVQAVNKQKRDKAEAQNQLNADRARNGTELRGAS